MYIDPLLASTYLGGGSDDRAYALAIDSSDNVYVAGSTYSSNFPTTQGAYDRSFNGGEDIFISKLDSNFTRLLASTYLGGTGNDTLAFNALTIDSSGNVYVAGWTESNDFPTTSEAYDKSYDGNRDGFISKLDSNLTKLLASTYLGGSRYDYVKAITIDSSGNLYVAGNTDSRDFPTISGSGAYQITNKGASDVFISKLDSNLKELLASTYLGGDSTDIAEDLVIDPLGNVYVTGYTYSSNFPTTSGAYQITNKGASDVFISKLDSNLKELLASTYLGGTGNDDLAFALAIDGSGNVYVAGWTNSKDFPTPSLWAYEHIFQGFYDGFVSKLNSNFSKLLASTYIGGAYFDAVYTIMIDKSDNIYLAGVTTPTKFPGDDYNLSSDAFILKLDSDLTKPLASTYFGGSSGDLARALVIDKLGNVYVAGWTNSKDFPTTQGSFNRSLNGGDDAFVSKFDANLLYDTIGSSGSVNIGSGTGGSGGGGCSMVAGASPANLLIWLL
ncbi:MAG: SBBP repeat-containing protein, partial [Minisyncoccia bacterium]